MQGPANQVDPVPPSVTYPGRLHITSATVYWSLRFGLDSERGATEITSLWEIKEFAEMSFKLPLSMQKTFFYLYNRYSSKRHYFSLPLTSLWLSFFSFFHNPLKMFTNERFQLHIFRLVLLRSVDRLILAPGPNISGCSVLLCLLPVWLTFISCTLCWSCKLPFWPRHCVLFLNLPVVLSNGMHAVTASIIQEVKIKILCLNLILIELNAHFKEIHIVVETIFQELRP